jgi:caffeoyl-CoA O-methyltransferase
MELVLREIEKYVENQTGPVSRLLEDLERETIERFGMANMLTGKVEGKFLKMLVNISHARRVVEIGTFTGYSALMMAEGLPPDGKLHTLEISEEYAAFAMRYFRKSPHGKKISLVVGPAKVSLRKIPDESVDLVFIDADKASYPLYYKESKRILKKGGIIAADNALWYGRVLDPRDDDSRAIHRFNDIVKKDRNVEKVLLTLRDGVFLIRKK